MRLSPKDGEFEDSGAFAIAFVGTIFVAIFAIGLSLLLQTPLQPQIDITLNDLAVGVIATLPLGLLLWWFTQTNHPKLAAFRQSQLEFFATIGFRFTPLRILMLSLGAGVSEELLFRGVLQVWVSSFSPAIVAIIVVNILFGVLHMRNLLYAVIAGGVGVYLSVLYLMSGNLFTVIVTHAAYDAFALAYTQRAIDIAGGPAAFNRDD